MDKNLSSNLDNLYDLCTVIIPTFFPSDKIFDNLNSIPSKLNIIVVDNSYNLSLKDKISNYQNCTYFNIGDLGLSKTFNFALSKINSKYILLTQPDVILRKNCIENLINGIEKYKDAGLVAPIVYDDNTYSKYDFYDLNYSKEKKKFVKRTSKKVLSATNGDFCVDAVNETVMLINVKALKKINGFDENYYLFLEDMDLCLRLKLNNYSIIKIVNAEADHFGGNSHSKKIKREINKTRIWHFTWSSLYFESKFTKKYLVLQKTFTIIFISIIKLLSNLMILRFAKVIKNAVKISACFAFILNRSSYFRAKYKD